MKHLEIEVDGRAIEAVWHGPAPERSPTLVFLHEGLGCVSTWRDFPQRLSTALGWGALVFSRFGYGRSAGISLPRPITYMHHEAHHVLPRVLRSAGVRRAALYGHSDGASIALLFAGDPLARTESATQLEAMVLESPHLFAEDQTIEAIEQSLDAWTHSDLRPRLRKHHGANTDNAFLGWNGVWLNPDFRSWNLEADARRNDTRCLAIQARDDAYGSLQQLHSLQQNSPAPVETLVFTDGGHSTHRTHTDEVIARCTEFLSRTPPAV